MHSRHDNDVQAVFNEVVSAGVNHQDIVEAADFYILEDGQNPYALVEPILMAGAKMEFNSDDLFEVDRYGADAFYFVGRKDAVMEKLRKLIP